MRLSELRVGMRVVWWWNNHHCGGSDKFWAKVVAVHARMVTIEFQDPVAKAKRLLRRRVWPAHLQTVAAWRAEGRPQIRVSQIRRRGRRAAARPRGDGVPSSK
jgi:hypothetical protein